MAIFSSTQPSLRARVLPRFPANVIAGTGMVITKSGGTYTFSVAASAFTNLPLSSLAPITTDSLLGRDDAGIGPVEVITLTNGLGMNGALQLGLTNNQRIRSIPFTITTPTTTGIKGDIEVPFACTILGVTLLADANVTTNNLVLDIWRDSYANYPPTIADTITASNLPTILVGAQKGQNTTLTGWNTTINAGDTLRFNVNSPAPAGLARLQVAVDVTTL